MVSDVQTAENSAWLLGVRLNLQNWNLGEPPFIGLYDVLESLYI